ncbi:hypothetical protein Dip510_000138 [Elusimicrobium posterum]|uniref:hypothetical protein n=1 Tax=Elusimicrobium posterum TaxID=3116653 RepID=UPI003C742F18
MRYWVYINDKVMGPYEESQIPELTGFTPETLICSEVIEEGASQEWVPASSVLNLPAPANDAVSESHISTSTSTRTYIAAGDIGKNKAQEEAASSSEANMLLLNEIKKLSQEIEKLRAEVKEVKEVAAAKETPAPLPSAGYAADPFEEAITKTDLRKGEVIAKDETPEGIENIAEQSTPPQIAVVPAAGADASHEEPAHIEFEDDNEPASDDDLVDSFPQSSVIPELAQEQNEVKEELPEPASVPQAHAPISAFEPLPSAQPKAAEPEVEIEEILPVMEEDPGPEATLRDHPPIEPLKIEPMILEDVNDSPASAAVADHQQTDSVVPEALKTHTLSGAEKSTEEDALVVSSALDSLYKSPLVKPAAKKSEDVVEFEDLMASEPEQGDNTEQATSIKTSMVPEVQLNEATSLISDFIPPSDIDSAGEVKKQDNKIEDIIGSGAAGVVAAPTAALTPEQEVSDVVFDNPVVKRVKPSDIKTNPLISRNGTPETTDSINAIDQFGTIEDITDEPKKSPVRKIVMAILVLLFLALAYVGLVYTNNLDDHFGLLGMMGKKPAASTPAPSLPAQPQQQMPDNSALPQLSDPFATEDLFGAPIMDEPVQDAGEQLVINEVKQYQLANGTTLESVVNGKTAMAAQIEWTAKKTNIDDEIYSVSIRMPLETANSMRVTYRFNYNIVTRELIPVNSDSKNILGVQ